ncbi:MAG TPA: host attachment protein [Woeseiaceae bacterium]|jgi:protein required for attachment to host cells|nr:host attachment protein [Woeseiaceae bacterium]
MARLRETWSSGMGRRDDFLLPNAPTCIVACAATGARFWRSNTRFGGWTLRAELDNAEAAARESSFASDRPGRAFDSFGSGRHALATGESGREHEARRFARTLADRLHQGLVAGEFEHIVLIAPPSFLGHLRAALSDPARRAVVHETAKDLTGLDPDSIRNYFR